MRRVAAGAEVPDVTLSARASRALDLVRASHAPHTDTEASVLVTRDGAWHSWWTWAGGRGNLTLASILDELDPGLVAEDGRTSDLTLRISAEAGPSRLRKALHQLDDAQLTAALVAVDLSAVRGLKFGDLLPAHLAVDTLSQRLVDREAARFVARRPVFDRTNSQP